MALKWSMGAIQNEITIAMRFLTLYSESIVGIHRTKGYAWNYGSMSTAISQVYAERCKWKKEAIQAQQNIQLQLSFKFHVLLITITKTKRNNAHELRLSMSRRRNLKHHIVLLSTNPHTYVPICLRRDTCNNWKFEAWRLSLITVSDFHRIWQQVVASREKERQNYEEHAGDPLAWPKTATNQGQENQDLK